MFDIGVADAHLPYIEDIPHRIRLRRKYGTVCDDMIRRKMFRKLVIIGILLLFLIFYSGWMQHRQKQKEADSEVFWELEEGGDQTIKWVDFKIPCSALKKAYQYDVESYGEERHLDWIDLLAVTAAESGGNFNDKTIQEMDKTATKLLGGETTLEEKTRDLKYFSYYREAYDAVLHGFVGEYEIEEETADGQKQWHKKYGLKAFSPIAKGFDYQDYDDFGSSRSYGYSRPHLGHDMMGLIGTPVVATESGTVEALGWNQYGGWRIGIRSFDGKRYYYYAHLRQNFPYCKNLKEGSVVTAGQVIGYMGHTGYSAKENVNNIKTVHLHFGMELIFDEQRREQGNEIWIDCYQLTQFLAGNRSAVVRDDATKEWHRIYEMKDPAVEQYEKTAIQKTQPDK